MKEKTGWKKFADMVESGAFEGGMAMSDEGISGDFAGPISGLKATESSVLLSVTSCIYRNASKWSLHRPEGMSLSAFGTAGVAEPSFNSDRSVSWYIARVGTTTVYPKGHNRGERLRREVESLTTSKVV